MSYKILENPPASGLTTIDAWTKDIKEQHLEVSHDQSMLTLANPDESLIVVGPPRLQGNDAEFHIVGMVNNLQYAEQSQVQPMKAIGSRRHVFSRSNAPTQGSIGRMLFLGPNLYRALYQIADSEGLLSDAKVSGNGENTSAWYANLEEDLFRIPFGMGIIYRSPANNASNTNIGADYLEVMNLINRNVSLQSGQTMIMEQVSFMADRVIPWTAYQSDIDVSNENPAGSLSIPA